MACPLTNVMFALRLEQTRAEAQRALPTGRGDGGGRGGRGGGQQQRQHYGQRGSANAGATAMAAANRQAAAQVSGAARCLAVQALQGQARTFRGCHTNSGCWASS